MENAVIRSTDAHPTKIGAHCLIGPNTHLVGCTLDECVFVATGVSVFHGARLGYGSEVRVNGVVHLRTELPAHAIVPIGWIAVGNPVHFFPPDQHDAIWAVQEPLNFPRYVYGVERPRAGESNMPEITERRSEVLGSHIDDCILSRLRATPSVNVEPDVDQRRDVMLRLAQLTRGSDCVRTAS